MSDTQVLFLWLFATLILSSVAVVVWDELAEAWRLQRGKDDGLA